MHEWCAIHAHDVVEVPPDSPCECSEKSAATHTQTPEYVSEAITNATPTHIHGAAIAHDAPEHQAYQRLSHVTQNQQQTKHSACTLEDGSICIGNDQIERGFTGAVSLPSSADTVSGTHTSKQLNENMRSKHTPILALASVSIHTQVENACSGEEVVGNENSNRTDEISSPRLPNITSVVMITQDHNPPTTNADCLSLKTPSGPSGIDNGKQADRNDSYVRSSLADYYTRTLDITSEQLAATSTTSPPVSTKRLPIITTHHYIDVLDQNVRLDQMVSTTRKTQDASDQNADTDELMVVKQCRPVDISEDGLADDDSWIDSADEVELAEVVPMCTVADIDVDRDSIDFTLHTIVEESCEESDAETNEYGPMKKNRRSASELERYYFFELTDGKTMTASIENCEGSISDASSLQSEVVDVVKWMGNDGGDDNSAIADDGSDMFMSSRLEEYFMSTFLMPQNKVSRMDYSELKI